MSEDAVYVDETVVTLEHEDGYEWPLIYLANAKAPVDYQRVCAGRVTNRHFQAVPLMDFALSPVVLRKIADLIAPDERVSAAVTFAEGKANSAMARGDYDERRAWLDLLILLGAS